jgi:hypothetical protein
MESTPVVVASRASLSRSTVDAPAATRVHSQDTNDSRGLVTTGVSHVTNGIERRRRRNGRNTCFPAADVTG